MWHSARLSAAAAFCVVLAVPSPAWATFDNLKTFKQTYPGKAPKAYSCKICHHSLLGKKGDLNAYGLALQKLKAPADAKKLTPDDLKALEKEDSDLDGVSNLDEIHAGTPLGEPAATPSVEHHEQGSWNIDQWLMPEASADTTDAPQAEYVGMETCAACHAKQYKEFQQSTHARIAIPGGRMNAQGCEMCHGPGSLHAAAGGGRGVGGIINPRKDPGVCFSCHLDKKAEFRLPHHHPVLEGKMSCVDCHSPHREAVRPWSATTMKDINEACFRCHKEQRGPFVWEHEALREGCTSCHKVHGSIHEKMLVARDNNLCLRCHTQVNFPTIGKQNHATRLPQGTCFSAGCHTAVHGSNFDDHLRY